MYCYNPLCLHEYNSTEYTCTVYRQQYTETKKLSNSKPCWYRIYNKNSNTKNGLKTDCSGLSTC